MRAALVLLVVMCLVFASPAWATFPGRNGQLAFSAFSLNDEGSDVVILDRFVGTARIPGGPRHIFARGSSPAFSPDGRRLVYRNGGGVWLTRPGCRWPLSSDSPLPCSQLRHLTRGWRDDSPAWSPNGKRIAFVRHIARIYSVRARGGDLRFLVRGYEPDWSPSGVLAFERGAEGGGIQIRERSGRVRTLTEVGFQPSWSPAGDRLAFYGYVAPGGNGALYTIRADGTGLRMVWEDRRGGDVPLAPTWAPDGRSIAFIREHDSDFTGAVYAVRPSGRGLRVLMPTLPNCRRCFKDLDFDALAWQALR